VQRYVSRRGSAFFAGILIGLLAAASASAAGPAASQLMNDPDAPYRVFVTKIGKTFVKDHAFVGRFATTVSMPDGTRRTIELVPTIHDGGFVVKLDDTVHGKHVGSNGNSYMTPNGSTTNGTSATGTLMVQLRDLDHPGARMHLAPQAGSPPQLVWGNGGKVDPATTHFQVSIYQVVKTIAFGAPLTNEYSTMVADADGSRRSLAVTPEQRDGQTLMRIDDGGRITEVPVGESVVTGNLVVSVADMQQMLAAFGKYCAEADSRCNK
jgi:hypothetical protein